ncbi:MAG: nucleotidyltransferase domain-containing protein [Bacillota bacterium]
MSTTPGRRRGAERRAKEEGERRRQAITREEAAARFPEEKYGVEKVYLFGSLASGKRFAPRSDIDLMDRTGTGACRWSSKSLRRPSR